MLYFYTIYQVHFFQLFNNALHEKPYFPGPGISKKTQKDHVNISINFLAEKRPYFPSPKS